MAIQLTAPLDLMRGLIYDVFGGPWIFAIVITSFLFYYATMYRFPIAVTITFIGIFFIYMGSFLLGKWIIMPIIILACVLAYYGFLRLISK